MARHRPNIDQSTDAAWTRELNRKPWIARRRRRQGRISTYHWLHWIGDYDDLLQFRDKTTALYENRYELTDRVAGNKRTGGSLPDLSNDAWWVKNEREVRSLALLIGEAEDVQRGSPRAQVYADEDRPFVQLELHPRPPAARLMVLTKDEDTADRIAKLIAPKANALSAGRAALAVALAATLVALGLATRLDDLPRGLELTAVALGCVVYWAASRLLYRLRPAFVLGNADRGQTKLALAVPVLGLIVTIAGFLFGTDQLGTKPDVPPVIPPPAPRPPPAVLPPDRPLIRWRLKSDATVRAVPSTYAKPRSDPEALPAEREIAYDCQGQGLGRQDFPGRMIAWYRLVEPAQYAGGFVSVGTLAPGFEEPPNCWEGKVRLTATLREQASTQSADLGDLSPGTPIVVDCQSAGPGPSGELIWFRLASRRGFVSSERVQDIPDAPPPPKCVDLREAQA